MRGVLPGHAMGRASEWNDNGSMSNVRLRMGEVQAIYFPDDARSVSKKFIEYDVWVQHRANGTAVTKIYTHVMGLDALGSLSDFSFSTYRVDPSATTNSPNKKAAPGYGAKVLLLCVNGETNNAVILGGIRDFHSDPDAKVDGHHHHSRFNGIDVSINKDGELAVTYQGAMKADGTMADGVDENAVGTTITISKNGNIRLADVDSANSITIDHENDKITVDSDNEIDLTAPTVKVAASSEFDVTAPVVDVEASASITMAAPQVTLGQGPPEPPMKAITFNAALGEFLAALTVYMAAIAPIADPTGLATPAMGTAIATFASACAAAAAASVTVA